MVSDRGDRIGFPAGVAADIMHLSLVHAAQEAPDKARNIWDVSSDSFANYSTQPATDWADPAQRIKDELNNQGILCTPEGLF